VGVQALPPGAFHREFQLLDRLTTVVGAFRCSGLNSAALHRVAADCVVVMCIINPSRPNSSNAVVPCYSGAI
jgi:hypothetical protein